MYRMLIAEQDDEYIEEITKIAKEQTEEIEIVGNTGTGIQVLQMVEEKKPDILIISVLLKGMMGIEVIRQIRKYDKKLYIIVVSKYDDFDFVKDSMLYGVSNYLLKPLNPSALKKELQKALKELKRKSEMREKHKLSVKREGQMNELADYSFIYTFLWNENREGEMKRYKSILQLKPYGYILNLEIKEKGAACTIDIEQNYPAVYQILKEMIGQEYRCVVGPKIGKRIITFICQEDNGDQNEINSLRLANRLKKQLKENIHLNVRIGIGNVVKVEAVHESYEQSVKALRYMEESDVVHIQNIIEKSVSHERYMEAEAKLLQCIKFGKEECFDWLARIESMIEGYNLTERKNKLLEIVVIACREVRQQMENEVNNLDYCQFAAELSDLDWESIQEWAYNKLVYILKALKTSKSARKSDAVKEALVYMRENYNKELPLDEVSSYVGVTPQHFSKIFKEETGKNYVEWLNDLRVEKAKEYLIQGNLTIKEICFHVGHNDPNYFSRLFKKRVGKSPSEFQKNDRES